MNKENKRKKSKKRRILKPILISIGAVILLLGIAAAVFIGMQISDAPDISEIDATPDGYLSTILDKNENVMNTLYISESNRVYVDLEYVPTDLQEAFIAIEDARFYDHCGIDIKGIIRAAFVGITKGDFSQGASTITQQLLKNNVFTGWMSEDTFYDSLCRKIQEQYLAIRLEQDYSKEWILENYLNTINLGGGTRGVQVAAQYYFGKNVSDLTLSESALIAGITKNPTAYNPLNNPEKSLERQKLVLNAMLEQEYITQEEYDQAISEDVLAGLITDSENRGVQIFSWFEDALLTQVVEDLIATYGYSEEEAWDLLYTGGLTIYSTQDTQLQEICETQATNPDWYSDSQEISIVMTDVSTGAVAAIVGGNEEKTASLTYNRATDSIRQPGSTIKVIGEYAAGIDTGVITLGTTFDDAPYTYSDGTAINNAYSSYKGMTTVRDAIAASGNIIALKTYQQVGGNQVYDYLQKLGITTLTEADKNEALSIGGTYNGVTNLEVTAAYNAIANDGCYIKPYFYTKVLDRQGNIVLKQEMQFEQAISKSSAALLTSAMKDVITSGTGTAAAVSGLTLAAKSGTTNDNRDLWFVGFSSYYTLGIWGGYDNNSVQEDTKYVKNIWRTIMEQAHADKENAELVDAELIDASELVQAKICTKCGNLAVEGLCDSSLQGNMTRTEYFAEGTQPTQDCDCHEKVTICQDSGMIAGDYCPESSKVENIYLKTGSAGTADEAYVIPVDSETTCDVHTNILDTLFGSLGGGNSGDGSLGDGNSGDGNGDAADPNGETVKPEDNVTTPEDSGWWTDFFGDLF